MAMFPCSETGHRYQGPQRTMYVAVADGVVTSRHKMRLCNVHFGDRLGALRTHAQAAQLELQDEMPNACFLCSEPIGRGSAQLFVTAYDQGQDREDFWAPIHDGCVPAVCEDWHLPTGIG